MDGTSPINGFFSRKILYKWAILHGYVKSPEGNYHFCWSIHTFSTSVCPATELPDERWTKAVETPRKVQPRVNHILGQQHLEFHNKIHKVQHFHDFSCYVLYNIYNIYIYIYHIYIYIIYIYIVYVYVHIYIYIYIHMYVNG